MTTVKFRGHLLIALISAVFLFAIDGHTAGSEYLRESSGDSYASSANTNSPDVAASAEALTEDHGGSGHNGPDTSPLFFIIVAVFIGAATRHFLSGIPVPFTALLLIIGIALGIITRLGWFETWGGVDVSFIADSFEWAAHIDPRMLFFIFLPILIFEAAFAMDLHTFKKSATNSVILAVPGILVALLFTGGLVYAIDYFNIGLEGWANWSLAFMFGSVISATDPVAVVALLKELGASKKLGTLIEGESLLNDGTAIVLFMVFFLGISGQASDANGFVEFARVSFGGLGIGFIIGWVILRWIRAVFNDALVEISVVVAAAYITFYIAEHFFHVSGVLALVALGLMIGGYGRSSISPEVEHFMHEFWELAGFIANCLIFLIVGFVIAQRTNFTTNDFVVLGIIYIGIHVGRAVMIVMHYPFMKNTGYGLPVKDAVVLWYGGLRGAIALALALIVLGVDSEIMAETLGVTAENATLIKDQFLFLIAGTVVLTLLINATTIKALLGKLGLLDVPPVKAFMLKSSSEYLRISTENHLQKLKDDRNLKKANWSVVAEYLPKEISKVSNLNESDMKIETVAEQRRRMLEKEKSSYWKQFKEGMISAEAVKTLTENVNDILDEKGAVSLSDRADLEQTWKPAKWLSVFQSWPVVGRITENAFFEDLAVSYDCAAGFIAAQECLSLMESMYRAEGESQRSNLEKIEQEINENIISGQTFVRNLRNTYPEIYRAIATRQAIRSVLNYELHTVERLKSKGRLDGSEAAKLTHGIEERLKRLKERPPSITLPETRELVDSILWVSDMDQSTHDRFTSLCHTKIYSTGQKLLKPGSSNQGIYIIARGNVRIMEGNQTLDVMGKGDVIGELAFLTKTPGQHLAIADTPVTALWMSSHNAQRLLNESPVFGTLLWRLASMRLAINTMNRNTRFATWDAKHIRKVAMQGGVLNVAKGSAFLLDEHSIYILSSGSCHTKDDKKHQFQVGQMLLGKEAHFDEDSTLWVIDTTQKH